MAEGIDDRYTYDDDEPEGNYASEDATASNYEYDDDEEAPKQEETPAPEVEVTPDSYLGRLGAHWEKSLAELSELKKGIQSSVSFGLSEDIDFLKPSEDPELRKFFSGGELLADNLPLSGLIKISQAGAAKLASKSPFLKKQLQSLAEIIGVGGVGATHTGLKSLMKGELPSGEDLLSTGMIWSTMDAGLKALGGLGSFTSGIINIARSTDKSSFQVLKEVVNDLVERGLKAATPDKTAVAAMEILEQKAAQISKLPTRGRSVQELAAEEALGSEQAMEILPKQVEKARPVQNRQLKVTNDSVAKLDNQSIDMAKSFQGAQANFVADSENLIRRGNDAALNTIAPRAATEKELGTVIKQDIESSLKAAKKEYKPLYAEAEEAATGIHMNPANTAREAGESLMAIERLETKPAGYAQVEKTLEKSLKDAGYQIQRNEEGVIELIVGNEEVSVSQLMELGRRLNEIADFESIGPSIKDQIKRVVKAVKQDIRVGLKSNPDALTAFELAEAEHAKVAARYGRESVHNIRGEQTGEKITRSLDQPTVLADLKQTLSPKQFAQVEREVLEKLQEMPYEQGKKKLRELKPHLGEDSKKLAESIVEGKNPANPKAIKLATQQGVLQELADSFATGTRPSKTLALWNTEKGQKLVTEALENSPNRARVTKYLQDQSFNDMVKSVSTSSGHIDPQKFAKMWKNPATRENVRMIGGEEAVQFFDGFESRLDMLATNAKLVEKLPTNEQILTQTKRNSQTINELSKDALKIQKGQTVKGLTAEQLETQAASIQRGQAILNRMALEDYPINAKIKDWEKYIKENLGLNGDKSMNVFGFLKLGLAKGTSAVVGAKTGGIPAAVASLLGYKYMRRLAISRKARNGLANAAQKQNDPLKFIQSMRLLGTNLEEE